jgi:hypothetical protein
VRKFVLPANWMFFAVRPNLRTPQVDHGQAGAQVAGEIEGRDAGTEREGGEGVARIVDLRSGVIPAVRCAASRRVGGSYADRSSPPQRREHKIRFCAWRKLREGVERDQLQRDGPDASLRLGAIARYRPGVRGLDSPHIGVDRRRREPGGGESCF